MTPSMALTGISSLGHDSLLQRERPACQSISGQRSSQLKSEVRRLCPRKPGVYGMVDRDGELIYLGKAKNLRNRILTYFRSKSRARKAGRIISRARMLVWETSGSEFAALLRELELIRKWRPSWNVQGQPRRRKLTFACLGRAPAAFAFLTRRPPRDILASFGPLPASQSSTEAIRRLNDVFLLRDCPQEQEMIFAEQGRLFAEPLSPGCLRLEIRTCLGPCAAACTQRQYRQQVEAARRFLDGSDRSLLAGLELQMKQAAQAERFEQAASLRDQWTAMTWLARRLDRLEEARTKLTFVYRLRGPDNAVTWYCIHGGRPLLAFAEPADPAGRRSAAETIRGLYYRTNLADLLPSYEHADTVWLVSAWFRKYPKELKKTLSPEQALRAVVGH